MMSLIETAAVIWRERALKAEREVADLLARHRKLRTELAQAASAATERERERCGKEAVQAFVVFASAEFAKLKMTAPHRELVKAAFRHVIDMWNFTPRPATAAIRAGDET